MRCHYVTADGERVHIPGCIGAAHRGPSGCTCPPKPVRWNAMRIEELANKTELLADEVKRLARAIRKFKPEPNKKGVRR